MKYTLASYAHYLFLLLGCCCVAVTAARAQAATDSVLTLEDPVYLYVEQTPLYDGGEAALERFLFEKVNPKSKQKQKLGIIYIEFIIEKNGTVSKPRLLCVVHPEKDTLALEAVKQLVFKLPAKMNGRPVRYKYVVPVTAYAD